MQKHLILSILFITIYIVSSEARSRSEYSNALGHATQRTWKVQDELKRAQTDLANYKASLNNIRPMSDEYEFVVYDKDGNFIGATKSLHFVNIPNSQFAIRPKTVIPNDHVVFYSNTNFEGLYISLPIGDYPASSISLSARTISSVKIPSGINVILYMQDNLEGQRIFLSESIANLLNRKFNDATVSFKIIPTVQYTDSIVTLFEGSNYDGIAQQFNDTNVEISLKNFGSIKIKPGYQLMVYIRSNSKLTKVFSNDESDFTCCRIDLFAKLVKGTTPVLILYEDINFQGEYTYITQYEGTFEQASTSSLKISDKYEIVLFENKNFTGSSVVISGQVMDLRQYTFNDKMKSFRVKSKSNVADLVRFNHGYASQFLPIGTHYCSTFNQRIVDFCNPKVFRNIEKIVPNNMIVEATKQGVIWSKTYDDITKYKDLTFDFLTVRYK